MFVFLHAVCIFNVPPCTQCKCCIWLFVCVTICELSASYGNVVGHADDFALL